MTKNPVPRLLIAWVAAGVIRVLLGSSTAPIAYAFFGIFWLVSLILLIAAVRQWAVATKPEYKVESICICIGLVALFLQGLLGQGSATPAAALAFLVSAIILLFIYGRRLRRERFIHP